MSDKDDRNILNKYKNDAFKKWTTEMIKEDIQKTAFPFAVMMENLQGDFNLSSVLRSCNALNGKEMFYLGRKQYDRRGAVGTQHYTNLINIPNREELVKLKKRYTFVALENNVPQAQPLNNFNWPDNPLIIIGEEGVGITKETLSLCDRFVYIKQYGSVRSFNAAVAGSIAMNDFVMKYETKSRFCTPAEESKWYDCAHCDAGYPDQLCTCEDVFKPEK